MNQGFQPKKAQDTSLSTKIRRFKELYEEIMQQMRPRKSQLRSFSPQTFSRMIQENFEEERVTPKLNLFSDVT